MSRTIANVFDQLLLDKLSAAVVRCLLDDASLYEWTSGRIKKATGRVDNSIFEVTPAIYVNTNVVSPRNMPGGKERNSVTVIMLVVWEEFEITLSDVDEPTISSVLQVMKRKLRSSPHFQAYSDGEGRLVERVAAIRVADIDGGKVGDDGDKNVMIMSVEMDVIVDAKIADQEFMT